VWFVRPSITWDRDDLRLRIRKINPKTREKRGISKIAYDFLRERAGFLPSLAVALGPHRSLIAGSPQACRRRQHHAVRSQRLFQFGHFAEPAENCLSLNFTACKILKCRRLGQISPCAAAEGFGVKEQHVGRRLDEYGNRFVGTNHGIAATKGGRVFAIRRGLSAISGRIFGVFLPSGGIRQWLDCLQRRKTSSVRLRRSLAYEVPTNCDTTAVLGCPRGRDFVHRFVLRALGDAGQGRGGR